LPATKLCRNWNVTGRRKAFRMGRRSCGNHPEGGRISVNGAERETKAKHEETERVAVMSPSEEVTRLREAEEERLARYSGTILDWV